MLETTQYRPKEIYFFGEPRFRGPVVGVTVKAGAGVCEAGQLMGIETATGKWKKYDNTATDGTQVARGVLERYVDASGSADITDAKVALPGGWYKESALVGLNDAARVDLGASSFGFLGAIHLAGASNGAGGGLRLGPTSPADAAYTVLVTDDLVLFPTAAAPRTITLPPAANYGLGRLLGIATINANTHNITVDGDSAETINGNANFVMGAANQCLWLVAVTGGWRIAFS